MAPKKTFVDEIIPGRIDWKILVRVIRLWKVPDFNNGLQTNSLEMVLIDEKAGRIHASIKRTLILKFEGLVEEGCAYVIENLLVALNDAKFKTSRHKYKLNFMGCTKCTIAETQDIPLNHFAFVRFADILRGNDEGLLIDVLGHVVERDNVKLSDKNGKISKLLDIWLQDLESNKLICTLWGEFADQMQHCLDNDDSSQPIIVILQLCKMKTFNGIMGISNAYNGTKLLINPDIKEVTEYKDRLLGGNISFSQVLSSMSGHTTISLADDVLQTPMMTISDIMEVNEKCLCSVLAKVIEVDTDNGWYYESCTKCFRKVEPVGNRFFCGTCDKYLVAVPRFKLQVTVMDLTGSITFVLFDRVVSQILGKSARDLIDLMHKEKVSANTPPQIDTMLDKYFLFKVEISIAKKYNNRQTYTIKKMSDDEELIKQFRTSHSIKHCAEDNELDFNNSLSPQLADTVKMNVEGGDSNMKVDLSQEAQHNSTECFLDAVDNTPSSKSSGKRSADGVEKSSPFEDNGTQASSTKMQKIVVVKEEPSD